MNAATQNQTVDAFRGRGRLDQLIEELQRQRESKVDFVSDVRHLTVGQAEDSNAITLKPSGMASDDLVEALGEGGIEVMGQALSQIGQKCDPKVPGKFLREMAAQRPGHTADMLAPFFSHPQKPQRRLVRCLDGQVRAFLSDRYRIIDNHDLAFMALDAVRQSGGEIVQCHLTDSRMRLTFLSREVFEEVRNVERSSGRGSHEFLKQSGLEGYGDRELPGGSETVHPTCTIMNSETGHGGLSVQIGILRAVCVNSAIVDTVASRVHIGEKLDLGMFQQDTIDASNKAMTLQIRDAVQSAFHPALFRKLVERVQESQGEQIGDAAKATAFLVDETTITQESQDSILAHFLRDYDQTSYGLAQAVARVSQDADADKAVEMEAVAGRLMTDRNFSRKVAAVTAV